MSSREGRITCRGLQHTSHYVIDFMKKNHLGSLIHKLVKAQFITSNAIVKAVGWPRSHMKVSGRDYPKLNLLFNAGGHF